MKNYFLTLLTLLFPLSLPISACPKANIIEIKTNVVHLTGDKKFGELVVTDTSKHKLDRNRNMKLKLKIFAVGTELVFKTSDKIDDNIIFRIVDNQKPNREGVIYEVEYRGKVDIIDPDFMPKANEKNDCRYRLDLRTEETN